MQKLYFIKIMVQMTFDNDGNKEQKLSGSELRIRIAYTSMLLQKSECGPLFEVYKRGVDGNYGIRGYLKGTNKS